MREVLRRGGRRELLGRCVEKRWPGEGRRGGEGRGGAGRRWKQGEEGVERD